MKRCPQCAEEVQNDAKVCRFCSYEFWHPPPLPEQAAGHAAATVGCSLLFLIGFSVLVSKACTREPATTSAPQQQPDAVDVQVAAEEQLKQTLIDSDSTRFRRRFVSRLDNGGMALCGEVNSKNRFGGYTGFRRFVAGPSEAQPSMIEGEESGMGKKIGRAMFRTAWRTLCSNPIQTFDR